MSSPIDDMWDPVVEGFNPGPSAKGFKHKSLSSISVTSGSAGDATASEAAEIFLRVGDENAVLESSDSTGGDASAGWG